MRPYAARQAANDSRPFALAPRGAADDRPCRPGFRAHSIEVDPGAVAAIAVGAVVFAYAAALLASMA